ncbi:MAG: ELM1/GtrOC1 family putative glycosyltransferase [Candidatus Omnitrophota bacterium]
MIDYILYIAVKAASLIIAILPMGFLLWVGRVIGLSMYYLHPRRKKIAYANLKAALSQEKMPRELKSILKSAYKNYGQSIVEMAAVNKIDTKYLERNIELDTDIIKRAHEKKKGIIFLTSHFGNWELSGLKSAQAGFPMYGLARPLKYKRLNDLLNSYRERLGNKIVNRGMSARGMIKALNAGDIVGILGDQDAGKSGVFINLLRRPASHAIGAARLARDSGASIIPGFIIRKKGSRHMIKLEESFTVPRTRDRAADIEEALKKQAEFLEYYVKQYPDQWMWSYTRWKSTPVRKVVILSDMKQGHLNQSLSVFNIIKDCRRDSGFKDKDTQVEIIEVEYRNRFARAVISLLVLLSSHIWQGSLGFLRLFLKEASFKRITHVYADIVISCGSSLSAVNVFLTRENNAKNCVIMKPGMMPLSNFNVAIIPAHDKPPKRDNVVITQGAPNIINEESMRDGSNRIREFFELTRGKNIGILFGGDTPEYSLTTDIVDRLIDQVEESIEKLDIGLLVTTSRRTPRSVEELLKKRLDAHSRCDLLVIANEKNVKNAVGGILDLSDMVLVSGESISMVSEAASSGKKTLVFDLEKRRPSSKHACAIDALARDGYIAKVPVASVGKIINEKYAARDAFKTLDNRDRMYKKLYRII